VAAAVAVATAGVADTGVPLGDGLPTAGAAVDRGLDEGAGEDDPQPLTASSASQTRIAPLRLP
jgi:hypothetical protein